MFNSLHCPYCLSEHIEAHRDYETKQNGCRKLYRCTVCQRIFSETKNTFLEGLQHSISFISIFKVKTPAFRRVDFICSPHAGRVADHISTDHRGHDGLLVWEVTTAIEL